MPGKACRHLRLSSTRGTGAPPHHACHTDATVQIVVTPNCACLVAVAGLYVNVRLGLDTDRPKLLSFLCCLCNLCHSMLALITQHATGIWLDWTPADQAVHA